MALIPEFLDRPNVLGIGEIGLNKNSRNELVILEAQIELARRHERLILVHTPHLEDKLKGTRLIMDALKNAGVDPGRVLIDHVEEHTVEAVLDRGFWAGMTLYPDSKCTPQRAVDIIERYGSERIWINSAGDWGPSDPLAVPKCHVEMRRRGHAAALAEKISLANPLAFLGQCPAFRPALVSPLTP
jgi:predicted metal-dependent TIM-barrel fold hydrolase